MNKVLICFGILFGIVCRPAAAQNTATNFSVKDCSNKQHDLFSLLDEGKVIVLVWVMPCGSCIGPAKTSYNVAKSFSASNPDRILYYLVDDEANTNCVSLSNWAANNNVTPDAVFSNASISMTDYGTPGMPKVVVLGGKEHKVFYNKNDDQAGNPTEIQSAVQNAIFAATGVKETEQLAESISVFPNPAVDMITINYETNLPEKIKIAVYSVTGQLVHASEAEWVAGNRIEYKLDVFSFPKGIYLVSVNGKNQKFSVQ